MQERDRPTVVHEELLQNENRDTLVAVGEECCRTLMRDARKWGWVVDTPGLDRMQDVTEFRHVPPLFRKPSVVVAAPYARKFESPEVSLQTLGNHWKHASRRLQPAEALFCRRAIEMGGLFDILRIQRNRLYHERGDIGLDDAGVLASSVLLLVKLAGSDLVEPERLEPLSDFSRRALMVLYSNGTPPDDTAEDGTANEATEDVAPSADHMEVLTRIERNQEALFGVIDSLASAISPLMAEPGDAEAVSDPDSDALDDAPSVAATSLSQRRKALLRLRNRIDMENDIKPWENICQGPIVDALLAREEDGRGIRELNLLSDVLEFRRKYDRHSAVMERLMERYGEEMLRLLAGDF